jgi:uncharacterized protein (TIGR04255 family)
MEGYKSLGQLSKAPLVYTIGVVYISVQKMEAYVSDIQDALRAEYPGFAQHRVESLEINKGPMGQVIANQNVSQQWAFNDPELEWGVLLTPDRIILHTVKYKHFDDFGKKFRSVLKIIQEKTQLDYYQKIAFRYIDNVVPEKKEGLKDYLCERFLSPEILSNHLSDAMARMEYSYQTTFGRLFLRIYNFTSENSLNVPSDLIHAINVLNPDAVKEVKSPFALIDTDHMEFQKSSKSRPFDLEEIISRMDEMHQYASMSFRQIVKKDVIEKWK